MLRFSSPEACLAELLTLIADLSEEGPHPIQPEGFQVRTCNTTDLHQLAALYFAAYEPGVGASSLENATADVAASFEGEYGVFWFEASPVMEMDGRVVSAVMTVREAPWDDTPACPFVIEVFTDRAHRRHGLARTGMRHAMTTLIRGGETEVALRVEAGNAPALALYRSLGFRRWYRGA